MRSHGGHKSVLSRECIEVLLCERSQISFMILPIRSSPSSLSSGIISSTLRNTIPIYCNAHPNKPIQANHTTTTKMSSTANTAGIAPTTNTTTPASPPASAARYPIWEYRFSTSSIRCRWYGPLVDNPSLPVRSSRRSFRSDLLRDVCFLILIGNGLDRGVLMICIVDRQVPKRADAR